MAQSSYCQHVIQFLQRLFFFLAQLPPVGQSLLINEVPRSHTTTYCSRQDSFERVISSSQRPLPDITQQTQQTHFHAPGGIRTRNLSRRAVADQRLRQRGHWDRQRIVLRKLKWVLNVVQKVCSVAPNTQKNCLE